MSERTARLRIDPNRQGHIATVTVVGLAYLVTYVGYFLNLRDPDRPPFSGIELLVGTLLGLLYLWLLLREPQGMRPLFGRYALPAYFVIQTALMLIIQFMLSGSSGIWLISMPLVATAVTELKPLWRWPIYLAALAGMILPFWLRSGSLQAALFAAATFSPAIVFVVIFVRLTQISEEAQRQAEELAEQLEEANHELAAYAVQVEELATTHERNRLAREIHDNLGHYLTVVNVQIKAAQAVMERDPARARAALEKAQQLTEEGLAAVRQSVSALRESPLGSRPLPDALAALAAETQAAGIVADLQVQGERRPLDPRVELTLYRAAQEGLTNVRKHARASRVDLCLDYSDPATVRLTVQDNGLGATPDDNHQGFGLLGLRERAGQLGGRLETSSVPGRGFSLQITLPADGSPAQTEGMP